MVTIAIIGVLVSISILSLSAVRLKTRDLKRVLDIKQVQSALELYFSYNGVYPAEVTPGGAISDGNITYLSKVPSNPLPKTNSDCLSNQNYVYTQVNSGTSYTISFCLEGQTTALNSGNNIATPLGTTGGSSGSGSSQFSTCGDDLAYSGGTYHTVQIGTQCWFRNNLDVGTRVNGVLDQADANAGTIQKYCYDDDPANCTTDGGLYQWHTAMAFAATCDNHTATSPCVVSSTHQGICPTGWHIPSDAEWTTLTRFVSGDANCDPDHGCPPASTKLKSVTPAWDGTDDYGFSALPAGYRGNNGQFTHDVNRSNFWTSLIDDSDESYRRYLNNGDAKVNRDDDRKIFGFSVRCVKD